MAPLRPLGAAPRALQAEGTSSPTLWAEAGQEEKEMVQGEVTTFTTATTTGHLRSPVVPSLV